MLLLGESVPPWKSLGWRNRRTVIALLNHVSCGVSSNSTSGEWSSQPFCSCRAPKPVSRVASPQVEVGDPLLSQAPALQLQAGQQGEILPPTDAPVRLPVKPEVPSLT